MGPSSDLRLTATLARPHQAADWERWVAQAAAAQARRRAEAELRGVDTRVKAHEKTHLAAAGKYATSAAQYTYARGPNGQSYAVGGSVQIDLQPVPGNPEETLRKAEALLRAALSPGAPSSADLRVAADAYRMAAEARQEIQEGRDSAPGQVVNLLA
jgi:hypothetical protein